MTQRALTARPIMARGLAAKRAQAVLLTYAIDASGL